MTIQTSNPNNPMSARKLISRNEHGFDLEQAAEQIVANLATLPLLGLIQEHPDGVRSILLNPQIIDIKTHQLIEMGSQWRLEVHGYNDKASLIKQLPSFLELVEENVAHLPAGQRIEIVFGVSAEKPRTKLNLTALDCQPATASRVKAVRQGIAQGRMNEGSAGKGNDVSEESEEVLHRRRMRLNGI